MIINKTLKELKFKTEYRVKNEKETYIFEPKTKILEINNMIEGINLIYQKSYSIKTYEIFIGNNTNKLFIKRLRKIEKELSKND